MITYAKVTFDGETYYMAKGADDIWRVTKRTDSEVGDNVVVIEIIDADGNTFAIDYDDPMLREVLRLLIVENTTATSKRILDYYPYVIRIVREFKALTLAEGFEIEFIDAELEAVFADAFLRTMSESRIEAWEQLLEIKHDASDSLDDRRENIIASIRSSGKLNTESINNIVKTYTNGDAESYFRDSTIYVNVNVPQGSKQYKFANLESILMQRKPAHLNLVVARNYATWGEIANDFADWAAIMNFEVDGASATWDDVKHYVSPR